MTQKDPKKTQKDPAGPRPGAGWIFLDPPGVAGSAAAGDAAAKDGKILEVVNRRVRRSTGTPHPFVMNDQTTEARSR